MKTSRTVGTMPYRLLSGLKAFLDNKKIPYKRFAAKGIRSVPNFVANEGKHTNLEWIKEGTLGKNSTWILIGWYKYDRTADNYAAFDGHWMTVLGFGKDKDGKDDPNVLIVHDPAERSERRSYFARITPLEHGKIDGERPAKGFLSLGGDVVLKPTADFGLIQGAYRLELD